MTSLFPEFVHDRQRANVPAATAEEYYRRSVYILFVEHMMAKLKSRFEDDTVLIALRLMELIKGSKANVDAVAEAAKFCDSDAESLVLVRTEIQRWTCSAPAFGFVKNAKEYAEAHMFPNIAKLLTILLTLPNDRSQP